MLFNEQAFNYYFQLLAKTGFSDLQLYLHVDSKYDFNLLDKNIQASTPSPLHPVLPTLSNDVYNRITHSNLNSTVLDHCSPDFSRRHSIPQKIFYATCLSDVTLFYHPLCIGFYSPSSDISYLGWGSKVFGSLCASYIDPVSHFQGNCVVVVTRHQSGYAHFIRDFLAKLCWHHSNICPLSELDIIVTDYTLPSEYLLVLEYFGFSGTLIPASASPVIRLKGSISVYEVGNGASLLPFVRSLLPNFSTRPPRPCLFLTRKLPDRRFIVNQDALNSLLDSFSIPSVDLHQLPVLEQLTYCSQYETCISSHGAQLINALSVKSNIVEFMPYPYSLSEWSLTMLKMCNSLFIRRFEILGFQLDSPILSRQALFHSYHPSPLDSSFSSFWQSSPFYINIDRVRSILESLPPNK